MLKWQGFGIGTMVKHLTLSGADAEAAPYYRQYLLTHSMEQSPSREANWFSASQEIPRILRNPKVHYRVRKCPQRRGSCKHFVTGYVFTVRRS